MKTYDFVFSLGFSCGTSQALRAADIQFASYPLDWVGVHDILCGVRAIETDFADWMNAEDMMLTDVRHGAGFMTRAYVNERTGMGFSHEFSDFEPFNQSLPKIRGSYEHRSARFCETLRQAKRILAVWVEPPMNLRPDVADYRKALSRLRAKCPGAEVDLTVFVETPGCVAPRDLNSDDGLTVVAADYRKMEKGALSHYVDFMQFASYLTAHATMPDPRTDDERKSYVGNMKMIASLRWGPDKSRFRRWLNQHAYKLFRSLERILQKRGLIHEEGPFWFWEDTRRAAAEVTV